MPNIAGNRLTITGSEERVAAIVAAIRHDPNGTPRVLESLHPMPEPLARLDAVLAERHERRDFRQPSPEERERARMETGYELPIDWCESEDGWGNRWPDTDTRLHRRETGLVEYLFDSAYGPPLDGIVNISTDWPELTFDIESECVEFDSFERHRVARGEVFEEARDLPFTGRIFRDMGTVFLADEPGEVDRTDE